ncbi:flavodoxin family protein [Kineococcus sp. SYSU DK003]|uniref:flavodoxin family protein n=1 Tax=Kineococcus sp. SYSU DK003 TaxID=3383124 RepID=UPI003D7E1655
MNVLVVYESMFGATRDLADAMTAALREQPGVQVTCLEVGAAPERVPDDVDLLVIGLPTHAFGLSSPESRAEAALLSHRPLVSEGPGVREWLDRLSAADPAAVRVAVFDTRLTLPGRTGSLVQHRLEGMGFDVSPGRAGFLVTAMTGPLEAGALERARAWARSLVTGVSGATSRGESPRTHVDSSG